MTIRRHVNESHFMALNVLWPCIYNYKNISSVAVVQYHAILKKKKKKSYCYILKCAAKRVASQRSYTDQQVTPELYRHWLQHEEVMFSNLLSTLQDVGCWVLKNRKIFFFQQGSKPATHSKSSHESMCISFSAPRRATWFLFLAWMVISNFRDVT